MEIGIGLPLAVPGRAPADTMRWAAEGERLGFHSLGAIDRLVYDNLEPVTALAAAAAVTTRVELITTVLTVGWRGNAVLLAKQLASVDQLSGGRLTVGVGLGAWPDDFSASGVPMTGLGPALDDLLDTMRRAWNGELAGIPALGEGRPGLLIGGLSPAAYARAARLGAGWVAPGIGKDLLVNGVHAVREEWAKAGRPGRPRVVAERYFCLGADAAAKADHYVKRYWADMPEYFDLVTADLIVTEEHLRSELATLASAGCDELVLLPCDSSIDQVRLLADAVRRAREDRTWN